MNDPKILFVKQFLAALFHDDVKTIPINNSLFEQGMENMARYFDANKDRFGPYAKKIELLFIKYSTRGEYREFSKMIESFNGRIVSLENPHYVKANIKLEEPYVEELLQNQELEISDSVISEIVNCFRQGAELT